MTSTEIKARELIIDQIEKLVAIYQKKADKEKAKRDTAKVTYNGEEYHTEAELQDAYACDCFSEAVYDRLLAKLEKAIGASDRDAMTESEMILCELVQIEQGFSLEIQQDRKNKEEAERKQKRCQELQAQGYTYREAVVIVGNEELMRFE